MEQANEDISANVTPRSLIILTVVLIVARVGAQIYEFMQPPRTLQSVNWTSLEQAKLANSTLTKPVLYEFYANWSDPCKKMEENTLSNKQIRELIEKNFTPIRITDQLKEKGKNPQEIIELQKKYRVFAFPTFIAVAPNGDADATLVGNCSSLTTYRFLSRLINHNEPLSKSLHK